MRHFSYVSIFALLAALFPAAKSYAQCASCQYDVELISNGDFESGNTGFTTSLDYSPGPIFFCPLCDENTYAIGANATFYHSGFSGSDHTNPPTGDFFIANGPGQSGALAWCQSFAVEPNTDYNFSFWARDVTNNSNPHPVALLQPTFNGNALGDTLVADGGWEQFTLSWNSGNATYLDLCLVNLQSLTGGNDFGLDDVSLTACYDYHLSQPAYAGEDVVICSGEQAQLGQPSISGYNYSWNNSTGLSSASSSNPVLEIQNVGIDPMTYTYVVTRDSAGVGCIASDTVNVTVLPLPLLDLGSDISVCPGETATIDAGAGWDSILWSDGSDTQTITTSSGTYTVTVTFGGCSAEDEISITEIPLPEVDLGPDQTVCETTGTTLYSGIEGTWSDGTFADSLFVITAGEFSFIYQSGVCFVTDTVAVSVVEVIPVTLPADTSFCQGSSVILNAGVSGLWNTGFVGSQLEVSTSGTYDIVVENGPCLSGASSQVNMIFLPVVDLDDDRSICEEDSLELSAYSDYNDIYIWSTGDSTANIYAQGAGRYEVEVRNECGVATDEILIDTYPCSWGLYIPSSFTPNDDPYNQSWFVQGYNVSNLSIIVYNRFGDAIFNANDFGVPWYPSTGIYDDVYNYRIEGTTFDGDNIVETGRIYLLR